jgi:NTE family protein
VLVDGGTVNPVPYDLLTADCDIVIAIDVSGERSPDGDSTPGYFETIFNSAKIMQHAILTEKLRRLPPDIYIAPAITDVRALEFYKAEQVFRQAEPAKQELKRRLRQLIAARAPA